MLSQNPFAAPLDKFIQHEAYIRENEAADIEPKELRCVSRAKLKSDMCRRGMLETRIFHLAGNLICIDLSVIDIDRY